MVKNNLSSNINEPGMRKFRDLKVLTQSSLVQESFDNDEVRNIENKLLVIKHQHLPTFGRNESLLLKKLESSVVPYVKWTVTCTFSINL